MSQAVLVRPFRMGKVQGYRRGRIWYLCYHENGRRRRPRIGPDRAEALKLAAQINGQLETGLCAMLSFEPITIAELRRCWLDHHEHVLRSSVHTIRRYRAATEHLLNFLKVRPVKLASGFTSRDTEVLVRYLREIEVPPNGHCNSAKRPLMDKGIKFILECCRSLFGYAAKRRHLPPYAENPIAAIDLDRIPVENSKPIVLFTAEQEKQFLEACDRWQFPIFLTLLLTGLRPGELAHLLLPEDLDLEAGVLRVRNKPALGWQVKTRNEREIPLVPELVSVLRLSIDSRHTGPVFLRRNFNMESIEHRGCEPLKVELSKIITAEAEERCRSLTRDERYMKAKSLWSEIGALREDRIRMEFMRVTEKIGLSNATMPKMLRHQFATSLQDGNVDPLIRNQLMGHVPAGSHKAGGGLGMTAIYTHSRPETVRRQLESALNTRPSAAVSRIWIANHQS